MALKSRGKASITSLKDEDLLDSLFDDEKPPVRSSAVRSGHLSRTSATDNIFSMLAEEVKRDGADSEDSDVSEADLDVLLKNMKGMDDMDAELLALTKKPSSAPPQTKSLRNEGPKKDDNTLQSTNAKPADEPAGLKKPNSAPSSTTRNYKKFNFTDSGDEGENLDHAPQTKDLDDLLDDPLDELPDESNPKSKPELIQPDKSAPSSPAAASVLKTEATAAAKKSEILFDDDDLMDTPGLEGDGRNTKKKDSLLWSSKESVKSDAPQRARTRMDEILESFSSPRLPERPPTGRRKDDAQAQEMQQETTSNVKESFLDEDVTFGSYQPTVGSTSEGRLSRRQSVRFSTEDVSVSTPEKKPNPLKPLRHRNSADWLGLKASDEPSYLEDDGKIKNDPTDSPKAPSSPLSKRQSSFSAAAQRESEAPRIQIKEEDDGWLAGALSRKKNLSKWEAKISKQEASFDSASNVDIESTGSKEVTQEAPRGRKDDTVPTAKETSDGSLEGPSPAARSASVREDGAKQVPAPNQPEKTSGAAQPQATFTSESVQQLLQMMQTQLFGVADAGVLQRPGDYRGPPARIIQLEGEVKTLQLERDQIQMMLENIQHRHKQDIDLIEGTHKARVKLLEDSASQRETRARRECEDLMERLAAATRAAEQEQSEMQAQHQRRLAQAQQDRDREVERLRDLQRKSILEMKKDHEDQLQRLKKLKEEEIDAVTSATSQTRSLSGVIEQMELFSSRLDDLSSRVEITHEHTSQGLEQGARHRDQQLRTMQERLTQQQKAMTDERAYLKEIIARMDTQLGEQQRQLEKERWKMTAEQAKAESSQRGLEEERRVAAMQMGMEREELERAKAALLDEQKSVMQHCANERRKLAAEWAQFHAEEKQRRERTEREISSLVEKREGSIIGLAQEQADLKLRTAELKQREVSVTQERETLERLRDELEREKERVSSAALKLKTRAQEVEAFSKLAAEKYEEGEKALLQAKRVEAEHEARLRNVHCQTEHLRQQELRFLKERMKLTHLQKDADTLEENLPIVPLPHTTAAPPDSAPVLPKCEAAAPLSFSGTSFQKNRAMALQASFALMRYTAQKDREYFKEEQIFLEDLKKKSYRSSLNPS